MEGSKLLAGSSVSRRLKSWWVLRRVSGSQVRSMAMGALITTVITEVTCYRLLHAAATQGLLPHFLPDVMLVCLSLLEVLASLGWSFLPPARRRALLVSSILFSAVSPLLLLTVSSLPNATPPELCTTLPVTESPTSSAAVVWRAVAASAVAGAGAVVRAAILTHSLMIIDEHKPQHMTIHYGILIMSRVYAYVLAPRVLSASSSMWLLMVGIVVPQLINTLLAARVSLLLQVPPPHYGSVGSLCRVLSSGWAMCQILTMALLSAALWLYTWNEYDIIKSTYLVAEGEDSFIVNLHYLFLYYVLIVCIVMCGLRYGPPHKFDFVSAGKQSVLLCVILGGLYVCCTILLSCSQGNVAGLQQYNYTQPQCSQTCRCGVPTSGFSPVCVPDSLTTYLSACHAGCVGTQTVSGVTVYTGCACASSSGMQRALPGACNHIDCNVPYQLLRLLTPITITFTLLALQINGTAVLRSVQRQDRAVALGLSLALVVFFTFTPGHLLSMLLRAQWCVWWSEGACLLQGAMFRYAVGAVSGSLCVTAVFTAAAACFLGRRHRPHTDKDVQLDDHLPQS